MKKERFFVLLKPFKHPFMTYQPGCNYTPSMWASKLGHSMTEAEFINLVEKDKRFKKYFAESKP